MMPIRFPLAALTAAGLILAPLALAAQTAAPAPADPSTAAQEAEKAVKAAGEAATGAAAEAAGAAVEGAEGAAKTLGERLQGAADKAKEAADKAKEAAAAAAVAAKTAADEVAADARNIAENATTVVGLDGHAFQLDADTVLSSSLTGKTVTTSDGAEAGTISDLIISLDGRVEGIILNMGGFMGYGGRNVAVGVDRLQIRDVIAGVPQLEIKATKAELDATPDFAPVKPQ